LVGSTFGLFAAALLFRVVSGQWGERGVTFGVLLGIVAVTVLRLLVAYWENKDSREKPLRRRL
jgi:hypothetical protein